MQIDTLKRIFKTFWWRFFCFRSESVCVLFRNQHTLKSSFRFPVPLMNRTVQCAGWENLEHVINKWFAPLEHSRFVAEVKSWPWIIFFCFFCTESCRRQKWRLFEIEPACVRRSQASLADMLDSVCCLDRHSAGGRKAWLEEQMLCAFAKSVSITQEMITQEEEGTEVAKNTPPYPMTRNHGDCSSTTSGSVMRFSLHLFIFKHFPQTCLIFLLSTFLWEEIKFIGSRAQQIPESVRHLSIYMRVEGKMLTRWCCFF